jgi:hypothetical protein
MPKAIFVSVTQTLKRAEQPDLNHDSDFLRYATCGRWRVNADRARGVEYVTPGDPFGVRSDSGRLGARPR